MKYESNIVDPDEEINYQPDTYEQIILRQMQRCIDNLSKEVTGGRYRQKQTKNGVIDIYEEDVRSLIINSVDTLVHMMVPFIKDELEEHIIELHKDIDNFKKELNERTIEIKGRGKFKVGELKVLPSNTLIWQELMEYKAEKYREIFGALVLVHNKYKEEIKSYEEE